MNFFSGFNFIYSGIFVLLSVGLCIFIHELGHFLVAKWRGLHVIAFSIGFKKVWSYKYRGVEYRIGCIPFGGYVELPQIDSSGEAKDENGNTLPKAKPLDKILTALAGPLCNVLLGAVFAFVIWIHGMPSESPLMKEIEVASVEEGSPEYLAGLRSGDIIETVNGKNFNCTWRDFVEKIIFSLGKIELGVRRGTEKLSITYTPAENDKKIPGEKIAFPFFTPRIPVVVKPEKGSAAEKAGIKSNDIILSVNGEKLKDAGQFMDIVNKSRGESLKIIVLRDGKTIELNDIRAEKSPNVQSIYRIGIQYSQDIPPLIDYVLPDSPAKIAGLQLGDAIIEVSGKKIEKPNMLFDEIQKTKGKDFSLTVKRGNEIFKVENLKAELYHFYELGVMFAYYQYPTPLGLFIRTIDMSYKTLRGILSKKGKLKARNLSGPVGIVHNVGKIVYTGNLIAAIYFLAFISYSLAIFNLLPIPVLDGGHIMIAVIESLLGKPLPERMLKPVYTAIFILLIGLMLFVTYYDVLRVIREFK